MHLTFAILRSCYFPFSKNSEGRKPRGGRCPAKKKKSWPQSHPAWAALNPRRAGRASSCKLGDAAAKNFQPLTQFELEHLAQSMLMAAQLRGTLPSPETGKPCSLLQAGYLSSSTYAMKLAEKFTVIFIRQSPKAELASIIV